MVSCKKSTDIFSESGRLVPIPSSRNEYNSTHNDVQEHVGENFYHCSNLAKSKPKQHDKSNLELDNFTSLHDKIDCHGDTTQASASPQNKGLCSKFDVFVEVPRRKLLVLFLCTLANFLSTAGYSLIAPFFPLVAERKGADLTTIGIVFSVYQLVGFIASPVIGNFLNQIGTKFVYISGLFVCGTSTICFGSLVLGPDGVSFIAMCIVCRLFESLGVSAVMTASIAIVSNEFPQRVGLVSSILNTGSALGLIIGPVVGGFLYELGGYGLPFYVIAGSSLLDALSIYFFLPAPQKVEIKQKTSMLKLASSFRIILSMVCVCVGIGGISIFDAMFALHIKPFHLSAGTVGGLYALVSGLYAILSPVYGIITDSLANKEPLIITFALSIFGLGFLVTGPSHLLPFIPYALWSVVLGFVFLGASLAGILVPSLACMIKAAHDLGYDTNIDTHALVSGLYYSSYSLGGFAGPLVGSIVVQHYGFSDGFTTLAFICFSVMLFLLGYVPVRYYYDSRKKANQQPPTVHEVIIN